MVMFVCHECKYHCKLIVRGDPGDPKGCQFSETQKPYWVLVPEVDAD
jgi:hypothetical protein